MKTKLTAPLALASAVAAAFVFQTELLSQTSFNSRDPGVRFGPSGAGGPIAGLSANELLFFQQGLEDFSEAEDVADGVGPRMNLDGCAGCHAQPEIGGTSPAENPQVAFASKDGGTDRVPSFINARGPVREARFVRNPDGTPDGGVHALFTITGREGADGCNLRQPDFDRELERRNVIFRVPTPVFGAGLIEQVPDDAIVANLSKNSFQKSQLGISGRVNRNGNDGTVSRFGWKAQNQSLLLFSGEAYNVEMGITNEIFQSERDQTPSCQFATVPNDTQNFDATTALTGTTAVQNFANFQRFLAPPTPSSDSPGGENSIARGKSLFTSIGCVHCHTPTLKTAANSTVVALQNQDVNLFSDLAIHDMGVGLADGVSQGGAGPREFRTAPLWGLGKRIFFLHDGRTSDLKDAIRAHRSDGSEANRVVGNYNDLGERSKQDLLNFLRSL